MNEAETRAEHIDPALNAAGWGVVEGSRVLCEHSIALGRLQGSGGKGARAALYGSRSVAEMTPREERVRAWYFHAALSS